MIRIKSKLSLLACLLLLSGSSKNNDLGIYPCGLGDQESIDQILIRSQRDLKTNPKNTDALFERSYALFINGQINEGLVLCQKLLTLENSFRSLDLHYRILKRLGDFESSLKDVSTLISTEKEESFLHTCLFLKATFLYRLNRVQEALEVCEKVEKDLSSDPEVFHLKALCYKQLNKKDKELESLEKAILLGSSIGQYRLSRAALLGPDKEQNLRDLNAFCEINTKNSNNQNIRPEYLFSFSKAAQLFLDMNEPQRALQLCRMGLAQGEEKYEIWKTQAQALIKLKKIPEAESVIKQAQTWLDEQDSRIKLAKQAEP